MAVLSNDVLHFLEWLPSYLRTCGDHHSISEVTLSELSNPRYPGYGFLTQAVAAYKRHLNPPPPPRPLEEVLTAEGLALFQRQTKEVQEAVVDTIYHLDPGPDRKMDDEQVKSWLEFEAGLLFVEAGPLFVEAGLLFVK